jgi:phage terminase large subunit-like protein
MDFLARLDELLRETGERAWRRTARPKQLPPDDPQHHRTWVAKDGKRYRCGCNGVDKHYSIFLIMSGRGFGKTAAGANWIVERALEFPKSEWAVLAPDFRGVRKTCFESDVGVLGCLQDGELANYRRNELQIILSNGSVIYGYSAENPEKIRGANLWGAWADEIGSWRYTATWYEGLLPALRKGEHPRIVATTTPRPTRLINDLVSRSDGSVHITRGATWENAENLSDIALAELHRQYDGTRLGRQELEGELLEDVEGALWTRQMIDELRVGPDKLPEMVRVVVAIDPAQSSDPEADETGIIVAGEGDDGHGYILADLSGRYTPHMAMRVAIRAYNENMADCVVAEANSGGDYIRDLLRNVDASVAYKGVRASRGKLVRAQPVSSLYEQGKIHHVGSFPQLEDQMVLWTPETLESPDRLDAMVWAVSELRGLGAADWASAYGTMKCMGCSRTFLVRDRKQCPHCSKPIELAS